jgi:hypothetical protein
MARRLHLLTRDRTRVIPGFSHRDGPVAHPRRGSHPFACRARRLGVDLSAVPRHRDDGDRATQELTRGATQGGDPGPPTGATWGPADQAACRIEPHPLQGGPHGCCRRQARGRYDNPSVHDRYPRVRPRGSACAHRRHALAREGARRRSVAGRAAGHGPGARALLADGLRMAQVRGEVERRAALHHRDRRAGHPLRPRSLEARGRAAAHRHPRMARLGDRADEDRRSAHQSDGAWRERVGRLPSGDSVEAGLRVLGQAGHDRVGPGPHRECLGGADEAPRLHAVRGAGRRLGCGHYRGDGRRPRRSRARRTRASGADRHPHQHARRDSARHPRCGRERQPGAVRSLSRGATRVRATGLRLPARRLRLHDGVAPADADRSGRFARRPGRLPARPRRAQLRADLARLRRGRGRPDTGRRPRQHHALLAH